jgi:hypothetical protein
LHWKYRGLRALSLDTLECPVSGYIVRFHSAVDVDNTAKLVGATSSMNIGGHTFSCKLNQTGASPLQTKTMQRIFVLDNDCKLLIPSHPALATDLMGKKRAARFWHIPLTIILCQPEG